MSATARNRFASLNATYRLLDRLTKDARRVLPGLKYCCHPNVGLSSLSRSLLDYLVALLHSRPKHPPDLPNLEWSKLLDSLLPHWILPFLYYKIGSLPPAYAPPKAIIDNLRHKFLQSRGRDVVLSKQLGEILEAFKGKGLPLLVLKGHALAHGIYPDAATRPSADLDLLVHPETMTKAREILQGLGYRCVGKKYEVAKQVYREELFLPRPDKPFHRWIELHWDLTEFSWPGRKQRVQALFDRAISIRANKVAFDALSPADALIHRSLSNAWWHYRNLRLIWICDVALLARRLTVPNEWTLLKQLSKEWRCRLALEVSLRLAQTWTGLRLPPGFDDFANWPLTVNERDAWPKITNRHVRMLPYIAYLLRSSASKMELTKATLNLLLPDSAWMRLRYPPANGWWLPAAYMRRWRRWIGKGFQ